MSDRSDREVAVFSEALELPADERAAYLDRACDGDRVLRERIEALLRADETAGDFLTQAPAESPARTEAPAFIGPKPGDQIGRYKLLQQIGEGGCGVVFLAEHERPVCRQVALKVIKPGMDTKNVIARFGAERQALALMDHANIARVLDAGATEAGRPFFVMELVRGTRITEYCDQHALGTRARLDLFVQVCQAVQHAHQKGIIHRDLKPSNILVTTDERGNALPKVIDFGIAKATTGTRLTDKTVFTAFEMLMGTPAYMSPEQAAMTNVEVDTRTDIYSLGVLLYELLTGTTPFDAAELLKAGLDEVRRVIMHQEPVRPSSRLGALPAAQLAAVAQRRGTEASKLIRSLRRDLDWIVIKALEKDRTRRYHTANGLAEDVRRCLADEPITARPPSTGYRFQKLVSRNKLLFGAISAMAILLVASLAMVTTSLNREQRARQEAQIEATKSQQTTRFLKDMLEGVEPSAALGQDTAMLNGILDKTAERVGREMVNQPKVEAELRSLIGRLYLEIGRYEKAEAMHRAAGELNRKLFGPESPEAAAALDDLGQALWKERKLTEAEAVHSEALAIRRRLYGNGHPEVAASLNHLGAVYRRQGKLAESEALTREGLEIRRKRWGNEHLEVADSLRNLAIILGDRGKRGEAEEAAREMLAMRRRLLGDDHPLVAAALADLSWVLGEKSTEADTLETEAFVIQQKVLGDTHPDLAKAIYRQGERMRMRGNPTESHAVLKAALSIQRKLLGVDHPDVLATWRGLGATLEQEGQWAEAEAARRQALKLARPREGNEGSQVADVEGLVRALREQGKLDEAEKVLGEVLTPAFMSQPASFKLLFQRADLMGRQGRWAEAAADTVRCIEHQPEEHYLYHMLAPLLVMTRNRPAYEQLSQKILPMFRRTTNPYWAQRVVIDCLLWPKPNVDLKQVDALADVAISRGGEETDTVPYFQVCKAMSSYRLGQQEEAASWAEKALNSPQALASAHAYAILAMVHWQRGHPTEARAQLAKGEALAPEIIPERGSEKIGGSWVAWLCARLTLDEAKALIESPSADERVTQP